MSSMLPSTEGSANLPPKQQTKELRDVREKTNAMWVKSKPISEEWRHFYRKAVDYIFDNQLQDQFRGQGYQRIQFNKLYPAYAQEIAVQLNRKTTLVAEPVEAGDAISADIHGSVLQYYYDKTLRFDERIRTAATLDGKINGIFIAKPYWDPKVRWSEENGWEGDIRCNIINPSYFGTDPEGEDYADYSDCEYILMEHRLAEDRAIRKWPEFKTELEHQAGRWPTGEAEDAQGMSDWYRSQIGWDTSAKDPFAQHNQGFREGGFSRLLRHRQNKTSATGLNDPKYVTITEYIFRDYTEIDDPNAPELAFDEYPEGAIDREGPLETARVKDPKFFHDNGIKSAKKGDLITPDLRVKKKVPKVPEFPNGRKVIRAGDIILNPKREDQVYPYKRWELILGINLPLPHNIRGLNAIEMARGLQDWLNVGASSLASYLMLMGAPITMVEDGAITKDKGSKKVAHKLKRAAGAVWKLATGGINKVQTLDPPQLSPSALQVMDMVAGQLQDLTGGENITLGKTSAGEQTGTEVAILAENAAQRQSLSGKLMDAWTVRVFEHVSDLIKKHKKPGDIVRVVGEQHENKVVELEQSDLDVAFDLKLHVVDAMPFSKMARKQEARETFELLAGTVGVSTVALNNLLDAYDAPNKEDIIAEVQQLQQAQQEAAQAAAQEENALNQQDLNIKQDKNQVQREGHEAQKEIASAKERESKQARETGRVNTREKPKSKSK